jgi:hypothetical protein
VRNWVTYEEIYYRGLVQVTVNKVKLTKEEVKMNTYDHYKYSKVRHNRGK